MKKIIKLLTLMLVLLFVLTGCGLRKKAPKKWYEGNINYYKEGVKDKWAHVDSDYYVPEDYKKEKLGYLLKDLDGDGTDELFIGIIDDSSETKFTDIIIYHNDFGPTRSFCTGEGYYIYICDNNIVRQDSWLGSETETRYMKYNSDENSWPIIDTKSTARKFELTPFE